MSSAGEHPGVPQRPPASAHLMVSSTDRYNTFYDNLYEGKTSANWFLNKQQNVLSGYFTRLAITQVQFFWNIPTVIEGVNSIFGITFNDLGDDVYIIVQIPTGFYTPSQLAEEMETLIKDDPDYDPAWDLNITGNEFGFAFTCATGVEMVIGLPTPDDYDPDAIELNRFLILIGFNSDVIDTMPADNIELGIPTMLATRWVDICSTRLTQFQRVKDATTLPQNLTSDVIARVYACPPGQSINDAMPGQILSQPNILCIDYNTPKHIRWSPDQAVNNFDIQVYDEYGQLMYWSPEFPTEYQFTFLASET